MVKKEDKLILNKIKKYMKESWVVRSYLYFYLISSLLMVSLMGFWFISSVFESIILGMTIFLIIIFCSLYVLRSEMIFIFARKQSNSSKFYLLKQRALRKFIEGDLKWIRMYGSFCLIGLMISLFFVSSFINVFESLFGQLLGKLIVGVMILGILFNTVFYILRYLELKK